MRVTVRYVGIVGDLARRAEETVELAEGATVGDLVATLAAANPRFAGLARQVRAVVDGQPSDKTAALADGAEVVLMRPIAGG